LRGWQGGQKARGQREGLQQHGAGRWSALERLSSIANQ
jgi:hypothetical protein